jgi:hypothetical protein
MVEMRKSEMRETFLTKRLAERGEELERYKSALKEIAEMGPHTAAYSAQTIARVALGYDEDDGDRINRLSNEE